MSFPGMGSQKAEAAKDKQKQQYTKAKLKQEKRNAYWELKEKSYENEKVEIKAIAEIQILLNFLM